MEISEFQPVGALEKLNAEPDPRRYVTLPGLEVAQAHKKAIRDLFTWIQCFNIYVAVVAKEFPEMVLEMLAYVLIVMRAQREYEEPAWRLYNAAFRDKAAATANRKWSQIDPHIYNQVFTGRARKRVLCSHYNAATHDTDECPDIRPVRKRRAGETGYVSGDHALKGRKGVCWDFNDGVCQYSDRCRFRHICSECSGCHPRITAKKEKAQGKGWVLLVEKVLDIPTEGQQPR